METGNESRKEEHAWWSKSVIPKFRKWKEEDQELEVILNLRMRLQPA